MLAVSAHIYVTHIVSLMKPAFFGWGFAGRIAMLLHSMVAGRTVGLRGPDLARGPEVARRPEVARPWFIPSRFEMWFRNYYVAYAFV